jgi:hypothetical protein
MIDLILRYVVTQLEQEVGGKIFDPLNDRARGHSDIAAMSEPLHSKLHVRKVGVLQKKSEIILANPGEAEHSINLSRIEIEKGGKFVSLGRLHHMIGIVHRRLKPNAKQIAMA